MNPPPLFVSFASCGEFISALQDFSRSAYEVEIQRLCANGLPPVVGTRELATLFGFSANLVRAMERAPVRYYRRFEIHSGTKKRVIHAPRVALKVIQSWLGWHLARAIELPECVHGFVPKRSTITAALRHCGCDWLSTFDIREFFPTTSQKTVNDSLLKLGYSARGASVICNLCMLHGGLPQGSPASPILGNLAFRAVDEELLEYCKKNEITYTRYADDLAFSGPGSRPSDLTEYVSDVVSRCGWAIAVDKTHHMASPGPLKMLGLMVGNDDIRLPRAYRRRIRAYEHIVKSRGQNVENCAKLMGHLAYAVSVSDRPRG